MNAPQIDARMDAQKDLAGRRVLLGVSSSIAAYRALDVASALTKRGAAVRVAMTREAARLVRPLAFEAITHNRAVTSLWQRPHAYEMEHLEWTKWAEVFVIAPATANILAKLACGIADDALTTFALAWQGPLLVAPAMNPAMWSHPAVQENVARLRARGVEFIGPVEGPTACGDVGLGRLAPVEEILERVCAALKKGTYATNGTNGTLVAGGNQEIKIAATSESSPDKPDEFHESHASHASHASPALAASDAPAVATAIPASPLRGLRVLVTSGPTREFLDPVRFLSNPSSGRMGHALAAEAARRGARVALIHGPVEIPPPAECAEVAGVISAREMRDAVLARAPETDIFIFAAAVSDWRPAAASDRKEKKKDAGASVEVQLVRNPDIARETLDAARPGAIRVGFAAETHDLVAYAGEKLREKRFDLIVANRVGVSGTGFASGENEAVLLRPGGAPRPMPKMPKSALAAAICGEIERILLSRNSPPTPSG